MIRLWEKFKAWRRGERMIPGATRGRCFEKIDGSDAESSGGIHKCDAKANVKLVGIKVIRKDGSTEVIQ